MPQKEQPLHRMLDKYLQKAKEGDVEAQYWAGDCYYRGKGCQKNHKQAFHWYEVAAKQDSGKACYCLAECLENGEGVEKDLDSSIQWYKTAFPLLQNEASNDKREDTEAMYFLGRCLFYGDGIEGGVTDRRQAARWFSKAANLGHHVAQRDLGYCYQAGHGVEQSPSTAFEWYQEAAIHGNNKFAQRDLAMCYRDGQGVSRDWIRSTEWFQKAIDFENHGGGQGLEVLDQLKRDAQADLDNLLERVAKKRHALMLQATASFNTTIGGTTTIVTGATTTAPLLLSIWSVALHRLSLHRPAGFAPIFATMKALVPTLLLLDHDHDDASSSRSSKRKTSNKDCPTLLTLLETNGRSKRPCKRL